jgi:TusA-related sulfurtransferase
MMVILTRERLFAMDVSSQKQATRTLDCIGLYCPMPILKTRQEMDSMAVGETLEVLADDSAAEADLKAWAKRSGQTILKIDKTDESMRLLILKER